MYFDFGKNLRDLRCSRGLTQEQAAELLDVSKQSVSRWENNVTYPDITFSGGWPGRRRRARSPAGAPGGRPWKRCCRKRRRKTEIIQIPGGPRRRGSLILWKDAGEEVFSRKLPQRGSQYKRIAAGDTITPNSSFLTPHSYPYPSVVSRRSSRFTSQSFSDRST